MRDLAILTAWFALALSTTAELLILTHVIHA